MDLPEPSLHECEIETGATPDLAAIRRWVRLVLAGARPESVDDALLLVTELVTNAVDHAHGVRALRIRSGEPGQPVRLEIDDPRPDLGVRLCESSSESARGRGLLLVDAISRRWGVTLYDDHKTVWADIPV
ncbi:ATP-binding protein [Amycolatopsis sp. NBC_00355]|uniref:ATP-binding protein n=1 Tax=Amycolatopsis sp. NBC_00355 TaxID=2975957 RepID=UPI002E26AA2B